MKKLFTYLFLITNLIFFYPNFAISKVVGDKIILGSAISLTGKYSLKGIDIQKGFNLAMDNINKGGGIKVGEKNYNFQIVYYDDESSAIRAAQIAKRLILQEGIQFILGPYSVELTKAMMHITEKNKVLIVEINNIAPSPITKGYEYIFSVDVLKNPIKESANALLVYKEAIESANSFDISKIREVFDLIIQNRSYLLDMTWLIKSYF